MAALFCSYCGKPLPPTGTFCPSCGAAIPGRAPAPSALGGMPGSAPATYGMPGYSPAAYPGGPPGPTPATRTEDLRSLSTVEWAAIVGLLGAVVGLVIELFGRIAGLVYFTTTPAGRSLSLPSPWLWALLLGFEGVIALVEIYLWRGAFRGLSRVDPRFSTPSTLALVALMGTVLAVVGLAVFLDALYLTVRCDGVGNPITLACLPTAQFFGGLALFGIGGLAALIGFIGILIGIWRLGTRYGEGVFKASAVLLIFPILNLVGAILILISARSKRHQVEAMATVPVPSGAV